MKLSIRLAWVSWAIVLASAAISDGADLQLLLPLGRTAYQTNETIDLAVVRGGPTALAAGDLAVDVKGADGSNMEFHFPLTPVPVEGKDARATVHAHLNGWLLRPGKYALTAAADGATATAKIELFSHIRQSTFRLIDWGSSAAARTRPCWAKKAWGSTCCMLPATATIRLSAAWTSRATAS